MKASNNILRVFPWRNSHTPDDDMVAIGPPGLWKPVAKEVHVSIAFTWDRGYGQWLQKEWAKYYPIVKLGGPGIDGEGNGFEPGMYLKQGITITTRGCPNHCPFCLVRDKPFRELETKPGWVIQDNNILAASREHFKAVINMLNTQTRAAVFRGGLDSRLMTPWHIGELRRLKSIGELWFGCDTGSAVLPLFYLSPSLHWWPRRKLRCYVLCGYEGQTAPEAKHRLELVWDCGFLPFAQLYQPPDKHIKYGHEWRKLAREWSRPAIMFAQHKDKK